MNYLKFLIMASLVLVFLMSISFNYSEIEEVPNFRAIKETESRKVAFFNFLRPIIKSENNRIRFQRVRLQKLHEDYQKGIALRAVDKDWLDGLHAEYGLKNKRLTADEVWDQLLKRVDIIPVELALAQAAAESAWGTSRFAVYGNSLFGQWTYASNSGMIPLKREQGAKHRVASFTSVRMSIRSYLRNLNTHWAYQDLRDLRHTLRSNDQPLEAYELAEGLLLYSEQREKYIERIRRVLLVNLPIMRTLEMETESQS